MAPFFFKSVAFWRVFVKMLRRSLSTNWPNALAALLYPSKAELMGRRLRELDFDSIFAEDCCMTLKSWWLHRRFVDGSSRGDSGRTGELSDDSNVSAVLAELGTVLMLLEPVSDAVDALLPTSGRVGVASGPRCTSFVPLP